MYPYCKQAVERRAILVFVCALLVAQSPSRGTIAAETQGASVRVVELRCEYLTDPLGLDVKQPRLSWRLEAMDPRARGQRQTAYQVLVADSEAGLAQRKANLWDSGEIKSSQSTHVPYQGSPLVSHHACFWKVRVCDERGQWTGFSETARWTTGFLSPADWSAKWIGNGVNYGGEGKKRSEIQEPDPWLRKTISLDAAPVRATMYVASVGYHELYINGRKVGDAVLMPNVSDHTKRARYVSYEIQEYLRPGENVLALWLGVAWSIYPNYKTDEKPQTPMVVAQAEIALRDGKHLTIVTDQSWKWHPSPNRLVGVWFFMNYGGEEYDANRDVPGWSQAGLDEGDWKPCQEYSPKLTVSAERLEPNRRVQRIDPVAITEPRPGEYRYDMGVNFTGMLEMDLVGKPGQRIEFQFSERDEQAMTHRLRSAYIIGPSGKGTFQNRFNYFTGRWITVKGLAEKPTLQAMRGYLVRNDYRRTGQFSCSNAQLNEIYRTTLFTFENLSLGGYVVDCPQRERMGYGGDGHATTQAALNNYDLGAFYSKWAEDWRDVQGNTSAWGVGKEAAHEAAAKGALPYTAPTYWGGGGPAWCGFCTTLPWQVYQRYGDVRILEENFDMIQRWLAYLETKSQDNLLRRWGGQWDFLGDWLWPGADGVNGDTRETLFFNNCYWVYNLQTAGQIAEVLGKHEQAKAYLARAEAVRRAVHKEFFLPEENSYVNGFQAYLSAALWTGVVPDSSRDAVKQRLRDEILVRRNGHIWAGITGGFFLFNQLLQSQEQDLILAMATKDDYPGWGDMLRRGATTLWESWDGKMSLLHSSYLYIGTWFTHGLSGIQVDPHHPGFQEFLLVIPYLDANQLAWVKGEYTSLYGPIRCQWKRDNQGLQVQATVPPNSIGRLCLPAKDGKTITEGGQPLAAVQGIKQLEPKDDCTVLELSPGTYVLRASR